jgi:hypothetical protein
MVKNGKAMEFCTSAFQSVLHTMKSKISVWSVIPQSMPDQIPLCQDQCHKNGCQQHHKITPETFFSIFFLQISVVQINITNYHNSVVELVAEKVAQG